MAATTFGSSPARADGPALRLGVDWGKLAPVIRSAGASLLPEMGFRLPEDEEPPVPTMAMPDTPVPLPRTSFVPVPHFSLIARDWGKAGLVLGRLAPTDEIRLSRSRRMIVLRVRLGDGELVPYAHVGLGQWRIDTDLLPFFPRDVENAAQLGFGWEIAVPRVAAIALETDYTALYREQHQPWMRCDPHVLQVLVAARGRF